VSERATKWRAGGCEETSRGYFSAAVVDICRRSYYCDCNSTLQSVASRAPGQAAMNSGPIESSLGWSDQMGRLGLLLLNSFCIRLGQRGA